jgi:hypothetical protein
LDEPQTEATEHRTGGETLDRPSVATTRLLLVTGDRLEVEASLDEVVKKLENAERSSAGTLAHLTQAETGEPVALNAAHVVAVLPGDVRRGVRS